MDLIVYKKASKNNTNGVGIPPARFKEIPPASAVASLIIASQALIEWYCHGHGAGRRVSLIVRTGDHDRIDTADAVA